MTLRRRPKGFTLIELLVAIAVMAMLALLSWRSIDGMSRTQTITQERSDGLLRLQSAVGQWIADLDAVLDTGEVTPVDFNGQTLRLTRRDSAESGLDSRGVRVVAWALLPSASGRAMDTLAVGAAAAARRTRPRLAARGRLGPRRRLIPGQHQQPGRRQRAGHHRHRPVADLLPPG